MTGYLSIEVELDLDKGWSERDLTKALLAAVSSAQLKGASVVLADAPNGLEIDEAD